MFGNYSLSAIHFAKTDTLIFSSRFAHWSRRSLGCILYEIIKSERLFKNDNELGLIAIKEFKDTSIEVDNLILKLLIKW